MGFGALGKKVMDAVGAPKRPPSEALAGTRCKPLTEVDDVLTELGRMRRAETLEVTGTNAINRESLVARDGPVDCFGLTSSLSDGDSGFF